MLQAAGFGNTEEYNKELMDRRTQLDRNNSSLMGKDTKM